MALPQREPTFNLKVVLAETGVKAHTVRAWEKKYDLPKPTRSQGGHRVYTQHDISIVKWLMARLGEGMTITHAAELWHSMEAKGGDPLDYAGYQVDDLNTIFEKGQTLGEIRQAWINSCLKFDDASAEKYLTQAFALYPIKMVCLEILQKSMVLIGDYWFENKATAQQELFTSAKAIKRLSALLAGTPNPTRLGRLLVACPPGEEHVFSILLLSLLLRYQGWNVVYLGPNLPLAQLETTINAIEPNVVVLAAQRLETAASLGKVTQLLAHMNVTSAFGGSIFNLIPSLRHHVSGHFLGETIEGAVQVINKIMTFEPPMHTATPLPPKYQSALKHYDSRQYLIDFDTRQALEKENIPFSHLEDTNDRLKKSILAALSLGNIDYINPELALAQQLMNNYGIPPEMQTKYLRAYHASSKIRLGAEGQIVIDWLDKLERANYRAYH